MNKTLIYFAFLLMPVFAISQVTQSFNYQTVVRDSDGNVIKNQQVNFDIQLLLVDSIIYTEDHSINTGNLGIVNLIIGRGNNPTTDFSKIDWSKGTFKLKFKLNGEEIGLTEILPVPIATLSNYANNAKNVSGGRDSAKVRILQNTGTTNSRSFIELWGIDSLREGELTLAGKRVKMRYGVDENSFGQTGFTLDTTGKIGIGADIPDKQLHLYGDGFIKLEQDDMPNGEWGEVNTTKFKTLRLFQHDNDGFGGIDILANGNVGVGTANPTEKLDVRGRTKTKTLEITGGGDGAEYFDLSTKEKIEAGALVIIDENNPGKLTTTKTPYDRRVAGIISGAGGVKPGITLKQEEVLDGQELVSLWGRVYVKATAANGKIKPGDFLTSSNFEGYAMKATNKKKSRGAIIGKALSSLSKEKGLVLVLIQPQ